MIGRNGQSEWHKVQSEWGQVSRVLALLVGVGVMSMPVAAQQSAKGATPGSASADGWVGLQQLWSTTQAGGGRLETGVQAAVLPPPGSSSGAVPGAPSAPAGRKELKELEGSEPVDTLSLEEARRRGFAMSHLLGASQAKSRMATELARASYAGVLPSLDLRMARGHEVSTPSSRLDENTGAPLPWSSQRRKEVYGVLSQPLFNLGAVADIRRAAAVRKASELDEAGVRGDVNYDVTAAFFGVVEASLTLRLGQEQQSRLERLGEVVSARAQAGGASGADYERIRARVLAAQSAVQDAISQVNQANITLARLTGSNAAAVMLPGVGSLPSLGAVDEAVALIAQGNPAVATARANEEAARHERQGALANFSPVVKLELSDTKVLNAGGTAGWKRDQRTMVVMTMPLLSGGSDYFRQRAFLAKEEQYEAERLQAERTARQNLQIAFSGLATARQKIESLRQQRQAQERVVSAFDAQLRSTSRNLLDVFDAYQQYHQSQVELVHTSVQAVLLGQQILRVTGRLGDPSAGQGE
uniref:TolC family protein n=1 Tax=unclassified Variovorax TaxID=663243 RepID=UPI000D3D64E1